MAPATSPATPLIRIFWWDEFAAATPTIRLAIETIPSLAPNTEALSQPMRSGRCNSGSLCDCVIKQTADVTERFSSSVEQALAIPRRSPAISANPHDFIEFPLHLIPNVLAVTSPLYKQGLSLSEIADRTGIPKTTIRTELVRGGISLRPTRQDIRVQGWRKPGKGNVKPPYGFCFLEGLIVRHPKEYLVLHQIHSRWKAGQPLNSIATWLNGKRTPSPMNKRWSWNSVDNIVKRFKNKTIVFRGGKYELR